MPEDLRQDNQDAPDGGGESNEPQYVTLDQLEDFKTSLVNEVGQSLNKGFTALSKRHQTKVEKLIDSRLGTAGDVDNAEQKEGDNSALAQAQKRIAKLERESKQAQEQAKQEKNKKVLLDALVSAGVSPDAMPMAQAYLSGSIVRDDTDAICIADKDGFPVPVADAVAAFVQTPQGKMCMPAKDVGGTGRRSATPANGQKSASDTMAFANWALGGGKE